MNGRMEKSYFEEKKCFALEALSAAIAKSQEVQSLIESTRYGACHYFCVRGIP